MIDHKLLTGPLFDLATVPTCTSTSDSSIANNLSSRLLHAARTRTRNPPYLVRRGGGIKVKPPKTEESLSPKLANSSEKVPAPASQSHDISPKEIALNLDEEWQSREWTNDEDMLFARLIVVRLRKFNARDKRAVRVLTSSRFCSVTSTGVTCIHDQ